MVLIGPISSIFDYATYGMMLFVFNAWNNPSLFQSGWFVESLLTQTLIIQIIRTASIPFFESHKPRPDRNHGHHLHNWDNIAVYMGGSGAGFRTATLWRLMLVTYAVLTHFVKVWFTRRWGL